MKIIYWSRCPGKFVDKNTGIPVNNIPSFHGCVMDWYQTLADTINREIISNLSNKNINIEISNNSIFELIINHSSEQPIRDIYKIINSKKTYKTKINIRLKPNEAIFDNKYKIIILDC